PFYFDFFFEDPAVEDQVRIIGPELPVYATILEPTEGEAVRLMVENNWSQARLAYWRDHPELKATVTLSSVYLPQLSTKLSGLTLAAFGMCEDERPKPDRADEAWWYSMKQ